MRAPVERGDVGSGLIGFVLTLTLALILNALPSRFGGGVDLAPSLPLIALFIWSVRRPWFVSPPVLLIVGVIQDLLAGSPMGIWAIAYLVAFTALRVRDTDGAGGEVGPLSLRFALIALVAFAATWIVGSISIGAPVAFGPLIAEGLITILLFPLFAWAFARRKERSTFS